MNQITTRVCASVCIATYNGEKWIKEQLDSILKQIKENDEVLIVDDCSTDSTVNIIQSIRDNRIKLVINENNIGHIKSFEKAIESAQGDLIFMSDQDDVWIEGRYDLFFNIYRENMMCVISGNTYAIDSNGKKIQFELGKLYSVDSKKYKKNIRRIFFGKAWYYGCAMAFSKQMKDLVLPFPNKLQCHDLWIALVGNLKKCNYHIDDYVLERRIHGNNASVIKRHFFTKIISRFEYLNSYFIARKRVKKI